MSLDPERQPGGSLDLNQDPPPYQLALKDRALASAAEGITISDLRLPDNPLIYVNRGFSEITGYTREESIGRNCRYLQGVDTDPDAIAEIRRAVNEKRPCIVELLNYRQDGTPFWNRLSLTPLRDNAGEVTHYIGVQSDVTRRRTAEEALMKANARLERVNQRMQKDLDAAAAIQRSLLPDQTPSTKGASFAWRLDACDELAGDTLNLIRLDEENLGIYVLDVSGHGVSAALLSVALHRWLSPDPDRSVLRSASPEAGAKPLITSPDTVARQLNAQFPMDPTTAQYFTLLYGILNLPRREFRYVTAGHPAPIHLPARGDAYQAESIGVPIGFFPESKYELKCMNLEPGDRVYLFSDGLPELENDAREMFGVPRILAAVNTHRALALQAHVHSIVADAQRWRGDQPLGDDLTLLGMEIS